MTYNFDPDRWYQDQRIRLDFRKTNGELSAERYETELEDLDRRYDEMLRRLDGTFQLAGGRKAEGGTPG